VSGGFTDAGSIPAASTIFPPKVGPFLWDNNRARSTMTWPDDLYGAIAAARPTAEENWAATDA